MGVKTDLVEFRTGRRTLKLGPVEIRRPGPVDGNSERLRPLTEALRDYDIVEVTQDAVIVTGPPTASSSVKLAHPDAPPNLSELGTTGYSAYNYFHRQDYNPKLRGKQGLLVMDEMRRSDAQVRMSLRLIKTPVLAARWYIEPGGKRKKDRMMAKFVWDNLTKWMSISWQQFLIESLLMLDFGWYGFEKVFDFREVNGQLRLVWKKFAPRHPLDHEEWEWDRNGGPIAAHFYAPRGIMGNVRIPIEYLALFTFDKEGGNLEGISALRSAYAHWYLKHNLYKIDAIQKERHGVGIPLIKLPPNFNADDKKLADEIGRNLRTNEKAHVVLPPLWELEFVDLKGQPVNPIESIEHHDMQIARNVLGQFINDSGGASQSEEQQLFLKATRFIAEIIRDTINKYCIPQLINYNWPNVDEYPELRVRRIGDTVDWRTISFALRNFVGAGMLRPDDPLEEWIRDEMDLPVIDLETMREVAKPQQPQVGPPRQSTAAGQRNGTGSARVGQDRSGG